MTKRSRESSCIYLAADGSRAKINKQKNIYTMRNEIIFVVMINTSADSSFRETRNERSSILSPI